MKTRECNIVSDLLPLHVDNVVSKETREFVEDHLGECEDCQKELLLLEMDLKPQNPTYSLFEDSKLIKNLQRKLRIKNITIASVSILLTAMVLILSMAYLTAPEYVPYENELIQLDKEENFIKISPIKEGKFQHFEINTHEEGVYSIFAYNTTLGKIKDNVGKAEKTPGDFILNPNGEVVKNIYYVSNNGELDTLIYGTDSNVNGGVITLPRLALNTYKLLAVVATLLLAAGVFVFRKKEKISKNLVVAMLLPISFLLSQFLITGYNSASYNVIRDLYAIILLAIPIFLLLLLGYNKWHFKKMNQINK